MAILLDIGLYSILATNGSIGAGWKLWFYQTGTTTLRATYPTKADALALTNANSNPIVLPTDGRLPPIWLIDSNYKYVLTDSAGVTRKTSDPAVDGSLRTVSDYGAATNGTTNARAAFVTADAAGPMIVGAGNYLISTSLTITNDVTFEPNGVLVIPNGVTVTFNGNVISGIDQIFSCSGTGAVVINPVKNNVGYAEWWGAVANLSTGSQPATNATAINAAIVALAKVELMPSDYFISATIKHNKANGWLCGAGGKYDSANGLRGTRVLMTDGTTDVMQIGPDANPGSIGLFTQNIRVTGIFFTRTIAPAVSTSSTSVRMQFVLEAYMDDVKAYDSIQSFLFNGTVHCIAYNCTAARQAAGTGGTDSWKGFYALGSSGIAAGGNASLYLSYCHADDNRTVKTNSVGFLADQKFTDLFILHCETVSCTTGIEISGNSAVTNDFGNTDLTIIHPIMDAFATYGIYIHDLGYGGSAEVVSPYCGAASGATSAIQVTNCANSAVNIIGGQLVMGSAPLCKGITIDTSKGVSLLGTIIAEAGTNGAVVLTNVERSKIEPVVLNRVTSGGPAVQLLNTCVANSLAATVNGKASGVTFGYQVVGVADTRNEYNCTGIDSAVVNGGSGNKLVRNGVQITAAYTLTGTNTTSGVMT
jgi:hypothetical protein